MVERERLDPQLYQQNVKFWERAWSGVKTPYTQMPDLPYIEQIPSRLKEAGARAVLDLGCGSGWLAILLARSGFAVTGIDVAPHAIELGQQWADQEQLPIKFEAKDIVSMGLPAASFDAAVANSIFEHLTYQLASQCLDELRTVLRPGGLFFGCFDKVGTGPGQFYELADHTHVYTDKGRAGMLLRCFADRELEELFADWQIESFETLESGSRLVWARTASA